MILPNSCESIGFENFDVYWTKEYDHLMFFQFHDSCTITWSIKDTHVQRTLNIEKHSDKQ